MKAVTLAIIWLFETHLSDIVICLIKDPLSFIVKYENNSITLFFTGFRKRHSYLIFVVIFGGSGGQSQRR